MKLSDCKVGDVVIGNQKASRYLCTTTGIECEIIEVKAYNIKVKILTGTFCGEIYDVDPTCFDLISNIVVDDQGWNTLLTGT